MEIQVPFGAGTLPLSLPENAEILESRVGEMTAGQSQEALVLAAMANPIGSPSLRELAKGKKRCTLIISDHTRPVPSRLLLPPMLRELRQGNSEIAITLLVATGCHRDSSEAELRKKLGDTIFEGEHIRIHDSRDPQNNVFLGVLPSGARCMVNRAAVETDLLIAEGFIEPHFFAGFSGGRKSVLPGVCDRATVYGNHCAQFIQSPYARAGELARNPIHRDMVEAARMAKLRYILNVVIDQNKQIVSAFAGDPFLAHQAGCDFLRQYCALKPRQKGDIVITSNGGYPLDQDIYQSVKGLSTAAAAAAPGAVLIIASACQAGIGGRAFYEALRDCPSPQALVDTCLATAQENTPADQWQYQILAQILCKHRIIYVTDPAQRHFIEEMKMDWAPDLNTALSMARREKGPQAHILAIPDGVSVMIQ